MSRERLGGGRGEQHLQLCLPGQRSLTFPTGDELCIATERGTGAALHGDGTRCPSRQPAELKESHMRRVEISISVIFQHSQEKRGCLFAISVGSNVVIVGLCPTIRTLELTVGRCSPDAPLCYRIRPAPPLLHHSWTPPLKTGFVYFHLLSRYQNRRTPSNVATALLPFCHPLCSLITAMISLPICPHKRRRDYSSPRLQYKLIQHPCKSSWCC